MNSFPWVAAAFLLLGTAGCKVRSGETGAPPAVTNLLDARKDFTTTLVRKATLGRMAAVPPPTTFDSVKYPSDVGDLAAYVGVSPKDGKKHPAIIWLVGGFSNSIGDIAWTPGPRDNDQSATAFRNAGIIMMYPSLRGGNDNPGYMESFYGEVNDVIAAANYLAKLDYVDPQRIYLGGHSTGGTLALLVAESTAQFRAIFSFGPVEDVTGYGAKYLTFNTKNAREVELRAPEKWLQAVQTPTFVFEGTGEPSNFSSLKVLRSASSNQKIHFQPVKGATHYSTLFPVTRLIAQKILQDDPTSQSVSFADEEVNAAFSAQGGAQ